MKTIKFGLVGIGVICFLIWLPNTASAGSSVYVGIGYGYSDFHRGYHHDHGWADGRYGFPHYYRHFEPMGFGRGLWYYRPYTQTFVGRGTFYGCWEPDCYIIAPPPPVIENKVVIVQPREYDKNTQELFNRLRGEKNELLKKLQTGNKEERREAIGELAGFSFDDKVRQALENILLSDPDAELRKDAAEAFGKVKNTKAIAALEKARVADSSEDVRREADNAIKRLKGN